ncbi:hypothetical protein OQA88_1207 [Cercophora sp. LCS_1]
MPESRDPQPEQAQKPCGDWFRDDPDQAELSAILRSWKMDPDGIISLGNDGVLRSLTADRDVIDAVGLRPGLIKAMHARVPPQARTVDEIVDGTKTPREQWFNPDKTLLPPPLKELQRQRAPTTEGVEKGGSKEADEGEKNK